MRYTVAQANQAVRLQGAQAEATHSQTAALHAGLVQEEDRQAALRSIVAQANAAVKLQGARAKRGQHEVWPHHCHAQVAAPTRS